MSELNAARLDDRTAAFNQLLESRANAIEGMLDETLGLPMPSRAPWARPSPSSRKLMEDRATTLTRVLDVRGQALAPSTLAERIQDITRLLDERTVNVADLLEKLAAARRSPARSGSRSAADQPALR